MITPEPRRAGPADAAAVAMLLDAFNREFDTPTPGVAVLAARLDGLLAGQATAVFLIDEPPAGVAVVTLRSNVWYDGPVALLDELYVIPGRRNEGRGSRLLTAVEELTRARGGERVEINVDGVDVDARRFYERHGYSCVEPGQEQPSLCYAREFPS